MTTVLISEPNAATSQTYLPYLWGLLKTSAEQDPDLKRQVNWLSPIYRRDTAEQLLLGYDLTAVDVLGLSCYTWNFDLQCEIAARVKAVNPHCITVAGGPHPDMQDPDFFRKHPYFDAVAVKDGEATFNAILTAICQQNHDFRHIAGLYLPDGADRAARFTGPPPALRDFAVSPYVSQSEHYRAILETVPPDQLAAVWETTRGCPYSCSYCDWGSSTMSKVRQFPMDRINADLDWLFSTNVGLILMTDANFGILPRDIEIAENYANRSIAEGNRRFFYFNAAKNNPTRSVAISKIFIESGVRCNSSFAVQHTDSAVLESVHRRNISAEKQYAVVKELMRSGAYIDTQLIMGMPGDTLQKWKTCLSQLAQWGLHDDYTIFYFNFLPNAPAADEAYRDEWQIGTIRRVIRDPSANKESDPASAIPQQIIVKSKSFSPAEWVEMNIYTAAFRALHCSGMTRLVAIALHESAGITLSEFYDAVIGEYVNSIYADGAIYMSTKAVYEDFLANENAVGDQAMVPGLGSVPGDAGMAMSVSQSVLVRIAMDIDAFFNGLSAFLLRRFDAVDAAVLNSVLDYQRQMLVLPDYDPGRGKTFVLSHDWPSYFAEIERAEMSGDRPTPAQVTDRMVSIYESQWQANFFLRSARWVGCDEREKWRRWARFVHDSGQKILCILHRQVDVESTAKHKVARPPSLMRHFGRFKRWLAA